MQYTYVHRRKASASLVEFGEGISELLDKQVDTQNKNLILGLTQALLKAIATYTYESYCMRTNF